MIENITVICSCTGCNELKKNEEFQDRAINVFFFQVRLKTPLGIQYCLERADKIYNNTYYLQVM